MCSTDALVLRGTRTLFRSSDLAKEVLIICVVHTQSTGSPITHLTIVFLPFTCLRRSIAPKFHLVLIEILAILQDCKLFEKLIMKLIFD